jgi:hypothetical protein
LTGVDKDLATLRDLKGRVLTEDEDVQFDSATNGVEAELSRLRELCVAIDTGTFDTQYERAEAAEAERDVAISAAMEYRREREAAEARLGEAHRECARLHDERDDARAMTRIANSRCARLQQAIAPLVTLVRIGFLVTVNGELAGTEVVNDSSTRELLFAILQAKDTAAAVEALAGPDTPDYRMRFVWLIERGQSLNHAPTVWLCQEKPYDFSPDPLRAIRYPTREAAETVIAEHTVGARSPWAVAVEHGFADTPADSQEG